MLIKWAQELGLIRRPAAFLSSICDERGEELLYAGMPISDVFKDDIGIGGVLSLLWFQRIKVGDVFKSYPFMYMSTFCVQTHT